VFHFLRLFLAYEIFCRFKRVCACGEPVLSVVRGQSVPAPQVLGSKPPATDKSAICFELESGILDYSV